MLSLHVLDSDGEYLGYLHSATRIAYLAELNGPGGGSFEINPSAADASLVQPERIIEVRWLTGAIGQWMIQTVVEPLVGATRAAMTKVSGQGLLGICLLYTSDAADERSSVDLGGRRIIKKKKKEDHVDGR